MKSLNKMFWKALCTALFLLCCSNALPQQEEYKMELGGMLGGSFYMGDANLRRPFKDLRPAGGIVARQLINPHMAVKYDFAVASIAGDTRDFSNKFPEGDNIKFKRTLFDLGAQYEYNFWSYGNGRGYNGGHRFTPYILGGVGFTFAPAPAEALFTLNIPVGIGVKYKLRDRLNIGMEFSMRFSLSDKLDVTTKDGLRLNDPYNIKSGMFKNKDSYGLITLFLTYDLFPKCGNCNKLE